MPTNPLGPRALVPAKGVHTRVRNLNHQSRDPISVQESTALAGARRQLGRPVVRWCRLRGAWSLEVPTTLPSPSAVLPCLFLAAFASVGPACYVCYADDGAVNQNRLPMPAWHLCPCLCCLRNKMMYDSWTNGRAIRRLACGLLAQIRPPPSSMNQAAAAGILLRVSRGRRGAALRSTVHEQMGWIRDTVSATCRAATLSSLPNCSPARDDLGQAGSPDPMLLAWVNLVFSLDRSVRAGGGCGDALEDNRGVTVGLRMAHCQARGLARLVRGRGRGELMGIR